jgi:hypothetical protein
VGQERNNALIRCAVGDNGYKPRKGCEAGHGKHESGESSAESGDWADAKLRAAGKVGFGTNVYRRGCDPGKRAAPIFGTPHKLSISMRLQGAGELS